MESKFGRQAQLWVILVKSFLTKESKIQVVYVGADGIQTNGPLIVIPKSKRRRLREFDDDKWTTNEAMARFKRYLFRKDAQGLQAAIRALDRLDCWGTAVRQLQLRRPSEKHAGILVTFWIEHGLSSIRMGLRDDMPNLIDAFRRFVKPYRGPELTLYRGELESRHAKGICGISWTPNLAIAKMFADRRVPLGEGLGVVLRIEATKEMIVAALRDFTQHTAYIGEDEYIVDPRLIRGKISVVD